MARRTALSRNRLISELNMTPLIDLTFLLLITFIITFPLIEQGIHVNLPKGKASELDSARTFAIAINDKAELFFDDLPTTPELLASDLKAKAEADPDVTILVRADESIPYGKVVAVLRLMHGANITRMALDKNNEVIGYEFVRLGKMLEAIRRGTDPGQAYEANKGSYGRFKPEDGAVKYIDPREE